MIGQFIVFGFIKVNVSFGNKMPEAAGSFSQHPGEKSAMNCCFAAHSGSSQPVGAYRC